MPDHPHAHSAEARSVRNPPLGLEGSLVTPAGAEGLFAAARLGEPIGAELAGDWFQSRLGKGSGARQARSPVRDETPPAGRRRPKARLTDIIRDRRSLPHSAWPRR